MQIGFSHELYLDKQTQGILSRVRRFPQKLYLEFGGKILSDSHASRVLPGFKPDAKLEVLKRLKKQTEIIIAISAPLIERKKMRSDLNISYADCVIKMYQEFVKKDLGKAQVVITRFDKRKNQKLTKSFVRRLKNRKIKCYIHHAIVNYPHNINHILSNDGFGQNPYIKTTKQLVVVVAPGPGSGKMATCLNQLYHEHKRKIYAGYAKLETFPVWNLPLNHPVNRAYEAATADLGDYIMVDAYHLEAYGKKAISYNRDMEAFPIVQKILRRILKEDVYQSPTDMGVNKVGLAITDDSVVRTAARQEIARRKMSTGSYK